MAAVRPAGPVRTATVGASVPGKEGDCLTITGADNSVKPAKCTDAGAYKVFLRRDGVDAATRQSVCDAVEDDFTDILYVDAVGTSDDLILCVGPAK